MKVVKKLNELTAIFGDFNCVEGKVNLLGGINAGISMIMTGSFNNYLTHPLFINMYEQ